MKTLVPLVLAVLGSVLILAIAVIATQNLTLVSLRFLFLRSATIPLGIVLAFSVTLGLILPGLSGLLWPSGRRRKGWSRWGSTRTRLRI